MNVIKTEINLKLQPKTTLQVSLYSGIALIVISMLFLGRGLETSSFVMQSVAVLAAPVFFYIIGTVVYRRLNAPLAAPGIIATGAWLVGVGLIHLYDQRILMPEALQAYYWPVASLIACVLITLTGHRVRIWMLIPLVALVQINAVVAVMVGLGVHIRWIPPLTFLLVLLWWEAPLKDAEWKRVYRICATLLSLFLLIFTVWLPAATTQSLMITWGAGAVLVGLLGWRHGWAKLGPLAIGMLTCATLWGLTPDWWPLAWLTLAAGTVILIEFSGKRGPDGKKGKDVQALEVSKALAVVLSGLAALFAQTSGMFGVSIHPFIVLGVTAGAGLLLVWIGARRQVLIATHGGLWLIASAWSSLYFIAVPTSGAYGLWLALLASFTLLIERVSASRRKEKRKSSQTLLQTMTNWPVADLAIALSTIALIWTALNINSASPWILTITLCVIIGLWLTAGLIYRLPVLLHAALWVAPLPYALLLILLAPALWTLPLLGLAWQVMGIAFLVMGHSAPRYRPAILMPFFIVGYVLLGFGFSIAIHDSILMPLSLTLIVVMSLVTSIAVIADYHPAWSVFVEWLIPSEKRPYAHKHIDNLFLFLSAWLTAVWLHLMLGYTGMPLARQGIFLVIFAGIWIVLGRLLSRIPGVVGWPVIAAGWFMWLIGLLEVFFAPPEAILTVVLGLAISAEALHRSKQAFWIPVLVMQVFFTALQLAWMFSLSGRIVLLLVAITISAAGMVYEQLSRKTGRIITFTGAALAVGLWWVQPDLTSLVALNALVVLMVIHYRHWLLTWVLYSCAVLLLIQANVPVDSRSLLIAGIVQWVIGAELVKRVRPPRFRTLWTLFFREYDWATPFLWVGSLCSITALSLGLGQPTLEPVIAAFVVAELLTFYALRLRVFYLPFAALLMFGASLIFLMNWILVQSFATIGIGLFAMSIAMIMAALVFYWGSHLLIARSRWLVRMRWAVLWLKPLLFASYVLSGVSFLIFVVVGSFYSVNPVVRLINGLLVVVFVASVYHRERKIIWLATALGIAWYSWLMILSALGSNTVLWAAIPVGIAFLALAKLITHPKYQLLEIAGTLVLLIGSGLSVDRHQLLSSASLGLALSIVGLGIYGYLWGRRIPFATGLVLILVGAVFLVVKINPWLVPLGCGLLLLSVTLIIEVQRDAAEQWVTTWFTRWQGWK